MRQRNQSKDGLVFLCDIRGGLQPHMCTQRASHHQLDVTTAAWCTDSHPGRGELSSRAPGLASSSSPSTLLLLLLSSARLSSRPSPSNLPLCSPCSLYYHISFSLFHRPCCLFTGFVTARGQQPSSLWLPLPAPRLSSSWLSCAASSFPAPLRSLIHQCHTPAPELQPRCACSPFHL